MIDKMRKERTNLTQAEFAKACGIPLRTYQRWARKESKEALSLRQIKMLCKALGIEKIEDLPDTFGERPQL